MGAIRFSEPISGRRGEDVRMGYFALVFSIIVGIYVFLPLRIQWTELGQQFESITTNESGEIQQ